MSSLSSGEPQEEQQWQLIESPSFRFGSASSAVGGVLPGPLFPSSSVVLPPSFETLRSEPVVDKITNMSPPSPHDAPPQELPSLPNSEMGFTQLVEALCDDSSQKSTETSMKPPITQSISSSNVSTSAPLQRDDTTIIEVLPLLLPTESDNNPSIAEEDEYSESISSPSYSEEFPSVSPIKATFEPITSHKEPEMMDITTNEPEAPTKYKKTLIPRPGRSNSQLMYSLPESKEHRLHAYTPIKSDGTGLPNILDKSPLKKFQLSPLKPSPFAPIDQTSPSKTRSKRSSSSKSSDPNSKEKQSVASKDSSATTTTRKTNPKTSDVMNEYDDGETASATATIPSSRMPRRSRSANPTVSLSKLIDSNLIVVGDLLNFRGEQAIVKAFGWLEAKRTKPEIFPGIADWTRDVLVALGKYRVNDDKDDELQYWKEITVTRMDKHSKRPMEGEESLPLDSYAFTWNVTQGNPSTSSSSSTTTTNALESSTKILQEETKSKKKRHMSFSSLVDSLSDDSDSDENVFTLIPPTSKRAKPSETSDNTSSSGQTHQIDESAFNASSTKQSKPKAAPIVKSKASTIKTSKTSKVQDTKQTPMDVDDVEEDWNQPYKSISKTSTAKPTATTNTKSSLPSISSKKAAMSTSSPTKTMASKSSSTVVSHPPSTNSHVPTSKATTSTSSTTSKATKLPLEPLKMKTPTAKAKQSQTASSSSKSKDMPSPASPHILASGLNAVASKSLATVVLKLGGKLESIFTDQVTHLVVNVDETGIASRTFKYLEAIVRGVWVVSTEWVIQSLGAGKYLPAKKFVVKGDSSFLGGPEAASSSPGGKQGSKEAGTRNVIFEKMPVFLNGSFNSPQQLKLDQIEHLLKLGGASVKHIGGTSKIKSLEALEGYKDPIVVCDETVEQDSALALALVTGAAPVTHLWILDSISHCQAIDTTPYLIIEKPSEDLNESLSW
jgi:hypothetical protein